MSTRIAANEFVCPHCRYVGEKLAQVDVACGCGWRGDVYFFDPLPPEEFQAAVALSDDAVCSNHPSKKAVAICSGTGDYICDLCRVDIKGETYSVQYLDAGGQAKAQEAFANLLPRPDRVVTNSLFLTVVTFFYGGIVFVPIALFYYWRTFGLRRRNPVYSRLVSSGRLVFLGFILATFLLFYLIIAVGIGIAVYGLTTEKGQRIFREAIEKQKRESMQQDRDDPPGF